MPEPEPEAALHGATWQSETLRDHAVGKPLEVGEFYHCSLLLRQLVEGVRQAAAGALVILEDPREGVLRGFVRDRLARVGRVGVVRARTRHLDASGPRTSARQVHRTTVHDGHDERAEAARGRDAVGAFPQREEGGVDGILGGGAVTEDAVGEAERATAVRTIELRERRGVTGLKPDREC